MKTTNNENMVGVCTVCVHISTHNLLITHYTEKVGFTFDNGNAKTIPGIKKSLIAFHRDFIRQHPDAYGVTEDTKVKISVSVKKMAFDKFINILNLNNEDR